MHRSDSEVAFIFSGAESYLKYSLELRRLGFSNLKFFSSLGGVLDFRGVEFFDYLIYELPVGSVLSYTDLKILSLKVQHIILLVDMPDSKKSSVLCWAWRNKIPLLGLVSGFEDFSELEELMSFHHDLSRFGAC